MAYVTTKKELERAIKQNESEIVVGGKLAKKLGGFVKLKKLSKKEMAALIALATGTGAVAVTAIATAAPTGGLSVVGAAAALVAAAPAAGVSVGTVLVLIALIGAIGLSAIALLKGYDFKAKVGETFVFEAKK